VKDWEEGRGHHVKHYKIKPLDNGGFFIATNQTFSSLPALVMAYSSEYFDPDLILYSRANITRADSSCVLDKF